MDFNLFGALENGLTIHGRREPIAKLSANAIEAAGKKIRASGHVPDSAERIARSVARKVQATLRKRGAKHTIAEAVRRAKGWGVEIRMSVEDGKSLE